MEITKVVGIGFLTLIATIILKEYRKEYAIYSVLIGGAIIIFYSMGTIRSIISFINEISVNSSYSNSFITLLCKNKKKKITDNKYLLNIKIKRGHELNYMSPFFYSLTLLKSFPIIMVASTLLL